MLGNRVFIGATVRGENPSGRFAHVMDGVKLTENTHPAIIDRATWEKVQKKKFVRTRHTTGASGEGKPLAGLLFCGDCGSPMYCDTNATSTCVAVTKREAAAATTGFSRM